MARLRVARFLTPGPAGDLAGGLPAALSLVRAPAVRDGLLGLLAGVTDGRPGQGRDHPVAAVLALAAARCRAAVESHDLAGRHRG